MAWISPTGHNDPDGRWTSDEEAYDDDTGSYAYNSDANYDHYLELTIAELLCDKVQIYARDTIGVPSYNPDLDIDVYYSSAWHNIWSGVITKNTWVEKAIGSSQLVTKARIKSNTSDKNLKLYEFDFGEALQVETDACSDPTSTSLQGNGDVVCDGGSTVTRRGFHYSKVFDDFEWGSDTDPLDDSGGAIDWTISVAGDSKAEISTAQHYLGTRSARLCRDGTNDPRMDFSHSAMATDEVWSMWVRKDETSRVLLYHGNGTKLINFEVWEDENLQYYDGTNHVDTGKDLVVGQWHLLEIKNVDWNAGTYDIYLDLDLAKSGAVMRTSSAVEGLMRYYNSAGTSECWFDNTGVWDVEDEEGSFGEGEYDLEITGLDSNTKYYVQALAENADRIAYGNVVTGETTAGETHYGAATLSGVGTLAGIGHGVFVGKSSLTGIGTLAAIGSFLHYAKANLSGTGTLSAIGSFLRYGKATLSGTGTLAAIGRGIFVGKATLSGIGTLTAKGIVGGIKYGVVAFSGVGTLVSKGVIIAIGKASLTGIGSLSAIGRRIFTAKATLSGIGTLTASAVTNLIGKATLAGIGTLSAKGIIVGIKYGIATFTGTGALSAIGQVIKKMRFGRPTPRSIPDFSRSNIQVAERHNIQEANRHNIQESKR